MSALDAETVRRCATAAKLHSQYPVTTEYDRGYDAGRKDAARDIRRLIAPNDREREFTIDERADPGPALDRANAFRDGLAAGGHPDARVLGTETGYVVRWTKDRPAAPAAAEPPSVP